MFKDDWSLAENMNFGLVLFSLLLIASAPIIYLYGYRAEVIGFIGTVIGDILVVLFDWPDGTALMFLCFGVLLLISTSYINGKL